MSDRLDRAVAAYNEVWQGWKDLTAANVEECRREAMRAALESVWDMMIEDFYGPEARALVPATSSN